MTNSILNVKARWAWGVLGLAGVALAASSVHATEAKVCPASGDEPIVFTPPPGTESDTVSCFRNGSALSAGKIDSSGLDTFLYAAKFAALDQQYPNASYRFAWVRGFKAPNNTPTCSVTDFHADGTFAINTSSACRSTGWARISAWVGIIQ